MCEITTTLNEEVPTQCINQPLSSSSIVIPDYSSQNVLFLSKDSQTDKASCLSCTNLMNKLEEYKNYSQQIDTLQNQLITLQHEFNIQAKELEKHSVHHVDIIQMLPLNPSLSTYEKIKLALEELRELRDLRCTLEEKIEHLVNQMDEKHNQISFLEEELEECKDLLDDEKKFSSKLMNEQTEVNQHFYNLLFDLGIEKGTYVEVFETIKNKINALQDQKHTLEKYIKDFSYEEAMEMSKNNLLDATETIGYLNIEIQSYKQTIQHQNEKIQDLNLDKHILLTNTTELQMDLTDAKETIEKLDESYNQMFELYDQMSQKYYNLCEEMEFIQEEREEMLRSIASRIFNKQLEPTTPCTKVNNNNLVKKLQKKIFRQREIIDEWNKKERMFKGREELLLSRQQMCNEKEKALCEEKRLMEKERHELEYKTIQFDLEKSIELDEIQIQKENNQLLYQKLVEEEKRQEPICLLQKENQELKDKIKELETKLKFNQSNNIIAFNRAIRSHQPIPFQPIHTHHYLN
jgi:DNA repair exonuclease SbcCD ATPase subunit